MLFGWGYKFDGSKLVAVDLLGTVCEAQMGLFPLPSLLKPRHDITNESSLREISSKMPKNAAKGFRILEHHRA